LYVAGVHVRQFLQLPRGSIQQNTPIESPHPLQHYKRNRKKDKRIFLRFGPFRNSLDGIPVAGLGDGGELVRYHDKVANENKETQNSFHAVKCPFIRCFLEYTCCIGKPDEEQRALTDGVEDIGGKRAAGILHV